METFIFLVANYLKESEVQYEKASITASEPGGLDTSIQPSCEAPICRKCSVPLPAYLFITPLIWLDGLIDFDSLGFRSSFLAWIVANFPWITIHPSRTYLLWAA